VSGVVVNYFGGQLPSDGIMPLTKQVGEPRKPKSCQILKLEHKFAEPLHLADELQKDIPRVSNLAAIAAALGAGLFDSVRHPEPGRHFLNLATPAALVAVLPQVLKFNFRHDTPVLHEIA
jgi:hypothetical protein